MSKCIICENEITGKRSDAKYCSEKCKHRAETIARTKKKAQNRIIEDKKCPICGCIFTPSKFNYKHQIYCSKKCTTIAMNKHAYESGMKKINSKVYREKNKIKISKHDLEYHNQRKFSGKKYDILKRDEYKCQMCGSERQLIIHHLDETGNLDSPNNADNNLITLCRSCHAKLHNLNKKSKRGIIGSTGL